MSSADNSLFDAGTPGAYIIMIAIGALPLLFASRAALCKWTVRYRSPPSAAATARLPGRLLGHGHVAE